MAHLFSPLPVFVHAITDGRDTAPRSAFAFLEELDRSLPTSARIVSVCGRFFAMDRDKRWPRTEDAYRLICQQEGYLTASHFNVLFDPSYYDEYSDEFFEPTIIGLDYPVNHDDGIIFMNFRADRMRQLVEAVGDPHFREFSRPNFPRFSQILTLTEYKDTFSSFCSPLFTKESTKNSLGEVLASHNKRQLRIAETEKYAHVTFFLNGGREAAFDLEERVLVPSPSVSTYNLAPSMSAEMITKEAINAIQSRSYSCIIMNFANADMVGHTGDLQATQKAIACIDRCLQELVNVTHDCGFMMFVTADHGNAEKMRDEAGKAHTAHTTHPVPFLALHLPEHLHVRKQSEGDFGLSSIAPTLLFCLNLPVPPEMTSPSLVVSS
jgi:2,3-bisphosphoglycerate-independent phosphoglycerate mutase